MNINNFFHFTTDIYGFISFLSSDNYFFPSLTYMDRGLLPSAYHHRLWNPRTGIFQKGVYYHREDIDKSKTIFA
jgi:hypothetical protein